MKRKFLEDLGLTKEQIDSVMAENGKDIEAEKEKAATTTAELEDVKKQLKEANSTITDLKKNNTDNETLQNTIKDHENTIATLKADSLKREKEFIVKGALEKAGATDVDYLLYKLGGVDNLEMDSEGKIKDLDNKIKDLQTNNSTHFKNEEPQGGNEPKIIENKLSVGNPPTPGDDIASAFANALKGNF